MMFSPPNLLFVAAATFLVSACASTPHDAVRDYARAIEHGRTARIDGLHSTSLQQELRGERLQAYTDVLQAQGTPLADSLAAAADGPAFVTASLARADGAGDLQLRFDGERWGITGGVGGIVDTITPEGSINLLVRALATGNAGLLYTLVPPDVKPTLSTDALQTWYDDRASELQVAAAVIQAALNWPIEVFNDEARLNYGQGEVSLTREGGRWYIVNF
jgi:hypothetical protein